jgi:hypothetical protein
MVLLQQRSSLKYSTDSLNQNQVTNLVDYINKKTASKIALDAVFLILNKKTFI